MGQSVSTAGSFINYKYVKKTCFHTWEEMYLITNKTPTKGRWDILNATSHTSIWVQEGYGFKSKDFHVVPFLFSLYFFHCISLGSLSALTVQKHVL